MSLIQNSIISVTPEMLISQISQGRDFGSLGGVATSNDSMGDFPYPSDDQTFNQFPNEISYEQQAKADGIDITAVDAYPADLGSGANAHYVKFEVYVVATKNTNLINNAELKEKDANGNLLKSRSQSGKGIASKSGKFWDFVEGIATRYNKVTKMIGLPMPDTLTTDHSTMWSRAEGGMATGLVDFVGMLQDQERRGQFDALRAVGLGLSQTVSDLLAQVGADGAQTVLQSATKKVGNPRNEFLFDGVNNRSFNFQWKFIPRSEKESKDIHKILESMKLYMYPELDQATNGAFFMFPAIFDITFMHGADENEHLYRTSSCALTNMIINYTGGGQWVANAVDGSPFALDVTMQFTEVEFLHRARFKTESNPEGVAR